MEFGTVDGAKSKAFVKNWCFTFYPVFEGHTDSKEISDETFQKFDPETLKLIWMKCNEDIRYYIYQYERCPKTGKIHVQGYVQFRIRKKLNWIKKHINPNAHFEPAKGDLKENQEYCSKDESRLLGPFSEGTPMKSGERVDLEEIAVQILEGKEIDDEMRTNQAYIRHYKYFGHLESVRKAKVAKESFIEKMKDFEPTNTQKTIYDLLMKQNNRQVLWIHDEKGNRGKSSLADYILSKEYDNTFVTSNMKHADLMHMYKDQRIILFDYTRAQEEQINYSSIEQFKSGRIFKTKYESSCIITKDIFKICIFANFGPDISKLSKDRWQIIHIDENDFVDIIENKEESKKVIDHLKWKNEYTFNKVKSMGIDHYFKYEPSEKRAEYADYFEIKNDSEKPNNNQNENSDDDLESRTVFDSNKKKEKKKVVNFWN